jgi:pimeloyl-ACP methyl ester carboxylesterase
MLNRRDLMMTGVAAGATFFVPGLRAQQSGPSATVATRKIVVPVDHENLRAGSFRLDALVVDGKIDPRRPTVFIVGDGQQFYIRASEMPRFRALLGPNVNIVGIAGRGFSAKLLERLGSPQSPGANWELGYQLLKDAQWTADIDAVRASLLGPKAKISIFGVSGGGFLLHAFMTRYGRHVSSAYSEVAALPPIEGALRLQHDHFWSDLPDEQRKALWAALQARPDQRTYYAQLLQRQNYFVPLEGLAKARADLIDAIARDSEAALSKAAADYQVDALRQMMGNGAAWPIRVREYEFIWPVLANGIAWKSSQFRPDVEVSEMWAEPLLRLNAEGRIPAPTFNSGPLNDLTAEVLIVCGRYDHISDYREQIAIAGHYRNSRLLILDDDHILHNWKAMPNARIELLRGWVAGLRSQAFETALAKTAPLIWHEA